jgi:urease accessory protein
MEQHMSRFTKISLAWTGALVLMAAQAGAHTGATATDGLVSGFSHPILGHDHLLAMMASGLLGWRVGGRAIWAVPSAFVSMMIFGGVMALGGLALPMVETAILASILVLGVAAFVGVTLPLAVAAGLAGFFAIFHGFAHGAEIPASVSGLIYFAGFSAATAMLHGAGILLGMAGSRARRAFS